MIEGDNEINSAQEGQESLFCYYILWINLLSLFYI